MNIKSNVQLDNEILKEHFTEQEIINLYKLLNMNNKQVILCDDKEYKRCSVCGMVKHISCYTKQKRDGKLVWRSECKVCNAQVSSQYIYTKRKMEDDTESL